MKGKNYTDWNKHFRDWEANPGQEGDWDSPSLDLWDKVAEDLPPPVPAKRRRWWVGFLGLTLLAMAFVVLSPSVMPMVSTSRQLEAFPVPMASASVVEAAESPVEQLVSGMVQTGEITKSQQVNTPIGEVLSTASTRSAATQIGSTPPIPQALAEKRLPEQRPDERTAGTTVNQLTSDREAIVLAEERAVPGSQTPSAEAENIPAANHHTEVAAASSSLEEEPATLSRQPMSDVVPSERDLDIATRRPLSNSTALVPTASLTPLLMPEHRMTWPAVQQAPNTFTRKNQLPTWTIATYLMLPADQGLQHSLRNWRIDEQQRTGLGLSLQRTSSKGWFGQLGLQYETADYDANTRYLRILNPAAEREEDDQLVSDYEIDASLLKSSSSPTTVTVERSRNQNLPQNLRIIFQAETAIAEQNLRIPLYLGRRLALSPKWGVQLQAGAVINQTSWERRTTSVTALVPSLRVREVRFPERIVRQTSSSAQLAVGASLHWQPHPHWQLGLQWQRIGTNQSAPVVLQQAEQQLLLGVGYRW